MPYIPSGAYLQEGLPTNEAGVNQKCPTYPRGLTKLYHVPNINFWKVHKYCLLYLTV